MMFIGFLHKSFPAYVFFAEVVFLFFAEKKLWKTAVTPLNVLMLPYAAVVFLCMAVSQCNMGYVPFCYESLWIYVVGLLLFFIPSLCAGLAVKPTAPLFGCDISSGTLKILERLTQIILALYFVWFVYLYLSTPYTPGSDDFAAIFAGKGFFGHLFTVFMILTVIWTLLFAFKENKRYGLYILAFIIASLVYQVKGWFLIPVTGAVLLRILSGSLKLKFKTLAWVVAAGFVFFFLTYWMSMFVAGSKAGTHMYKISKTEYALSTVEYIPRHFITYTTAGVYGFSEDLHEGIYEERNPAMIYTCYYNIARFVAGKPLLSAVNPHHLQTTTSDTLTNVRGFFGSLYVFLGPWAAVAFILVFSVFAYLLWVFSARKKHIFLWVFYAWILGCLCMGWFEFYFQHLNFITVPAYSAILAVFVYYIQYKHKSVIEFIKHDLMSILTGVDFWQRMQVLAVCLLGITILIPVPRNISSYIMGFCLGIALVHWCVLKKEEKFNACFRFALPYLALYGVYLLSAAFSSNPSLSFSYCGHYFALVLLPLAFVGMSPGFFTPKRLRYFAYAFLGGMSVYMLWKAGVILYAYGNNPIMTPYREQSYIWGMRKIITYFGYVTEGCGKLLVHPAFEAVFSVCAVALVLAAWIRREPEFSRWYVSWGAAVFLVLETVNLLLFCTKTSATGIVVLLAGAVVYGLVKRRYVFSASLFLCMFLAAGMILRNGGMSDKLELMVVNAKGFLAEKSVAESDGSFTPRVCAYELGWDMFKEKPLIGRGAAYKKEFSQRFEQKYKQTLQRYDEVEFKVLGHPHNLFFAVMDSCGMAGLFFLVWIFASAFWETYKRKSVFWWVWLVALITICCIDTLFNRTVGFVYLCAFHGVLFCINREGLCRRN